MTNAPKKKGTAAESAACRWLTGELGFPITRNPPAGAADIGDLFGVPNMTVEVKNTVTPNIQAWGRELDKEVANAGTRFGVVLWSPPGVGMANVDRWVALEWRESCLPGFPVQPAPMVGPVLRLHKLVAQVHAAGWNAVLMNARGQDCSKYTWQVRARHAADWVAVYREMAF